MGTYLNPGNQNFLAQANSLYIDKTMLIDATNRRLDDPTYKFVCISRPRRFGKSLAEDMLCAYYSKGADSRMLFSKFKIAETDGFEDNLNKFNVIKIDMNALYGSWNTIDKDSPHPRYIVNYMTDLICGDFQKEFPRLSFPDTKTVSSYIQHVYQETGEKFIIIIDEYDILVREQVEKKDFDLYLSFLVSLFKNSALKPAISLTYITGILPIIKDKVQSKLNTFKEYTMLDADDFSEFTGFTSQEVEILCKEYGRDFQECKSWYDGYRVGHFDIYNPEAVVLAVPKGKYKPYWGSTSTYEVISEKINMNFSGIRDDVVKMLSGSRIDVDVLGYRNTLSDFTSKDDVYTYLIHLGYLAYEEASGRCYIPNREISGEWQRAIRGDESYAKTNEIVSDSKKLLMETLRGNEEAVSKALDRSHIHITSLRSYNNEDALHCAIYLAYIYALNEYLVEREMPAGKGIADIVYVPIKKGIPALIIELKHCGSAETALKQIKEKRYYDCLNTWMGKILFVGINYDEKSKKHTCRIETLEKS